MSFDEITSLNSSIVAGVLSYQRVAELVEDGALFVGERMSSGGVAKQVARVSSRFQFSTGTQMLISLFALPGLVICAGRATARLLGGNSDRRFDDLMAVVGLALFIGTIVLFRGGTVVKSPTQQYLHQRNRWVLYGVSLALDGADVARLEMTGAAPSLVFSRMWLMMAFNFDRGARSLLFSRQARLGGGASGAKTDKGASVMNRDLAAVQERGVLRVGTSGDYYPFSYRDRRGNLVGLDIDIAEEFGRRLGVRVEFIPFRWSTLMEDFHGGQFDIGMSGLNVTESRMAEASFTSSYLESGAIPVVRRGVGVKRWQDLNNPQYRLVVNRGGYLEGVARKHFPDAQITPISDNLKLPEYLEQGQADAFLTDSLEVRFFLSRHADMLALGEMTSDPHAYMVPKESPSLLRAFNDFLDELLHSERIKGLRKKYGIQE